MTRKTKKSGIWRSGRSETPVRINSVARVCKSLEGHLGKEGEVVSFQN